MYHLLHSCSLLLLLFGLSTATLQLSSSPDTNGSYCPGMVTFTCVGINVAYGIGWKLNGSTVYTYETFGNQGNESRFPTFIITVKNVVPSSTTLNITLELSGNVSDLWHSTVLCRTPTPEESDTYLIFPSVPEIPDNIRVDPVYNFRSKILSEIRVCWNVLNELCMDYSYQVMLTNGSSTLRSENVNCRRDTECQVKFIITTSQMFDRYIVQVVTLDFQGLPVNTSILPPVDYVSLVLPNIFVEVFPCFIRCYSDPKLNGACKIDFSDVSVSGTVNSGDIEILETLQSGTVNYSATFKIDGRTYTFQNSTNVQYNNKWTAQILTCVILAPFFCLLSIILIILTGVGLLKRKDDINGHLGYPVIIVCTILPSIIFLLVSLSCWIAGLVDVSKTNNCSSLDRPQNILIAACIISLFTVILDLTAISLLHIYHLKKTGQSTQSFNLHELEPHENKDIVKNLRRNEVGMLVDEDGRKVVEDGIGTSGHKCYGETTEEARRRVAEQHTECAKNLKADQGNTSKSGTKSNIYSQTKHTDPSSKQKKKPKQESNYSNMGRKPDISPEDRHYAKLQHNNSVSIPPAVSPPGVFNTATTASGGSMPLSSPTGYSQVGTQPSELPSNVNKASVERNGSGPEYQTLKHQKTAEQENMTRNSSRKAEEKEEDKNISIRETC